MTQLFTCLLMDSVPRSHRFVYILRNNSAKHHILECGDLGWGLWPQIETWPRFFYIAPSHQVSSSYI